MLKNSANVISIALQIEFIVEILVSFKPFSAEQMQLLDNSADQANFSAVKFLLFRSSSILFAI